MANVYVVTDSTADIPIALRAQLNIEMIPLTVNFGDEALLDGVDIDADTFYDRLVSEDVTPTTSQPSPGDFLKLYKRILQEDPEAHILSIHISSALSGTFQSATLAKNLLEQDGNKVTLFDTLSASYGIGVLAVEAAKAAKNGKSVEEILSLLKHLRKEMGIYFLVDTLEYLQKGGRIGKAAALVGSLLKIKPILTVDAEGEVASVDKVRGHQKAIGRIIELLKEKFPGDEKMCLYVLHAKSEENAELLKAKVSEHFRLAEVDYREIGAVIGTHAGPGTTAVIMVPYNEQSL